MKVLGKVNVCSSFKLKCMKVLGKVNVCSSFKLKCMKVLENKCMQLHLNYFMKITLNSDFYLLNPWDSNINNIKRKSSILFKKGKGHFKQKNLDIWFSKLHK